MKEPHYLKRLVEGGFVRRDGDAPKWAAATQLEFIEAVHYYAEDEY